MTTWQRPSVPLLCFLGATETVTGSRFLVDTPRARVLIDCGLFQGLKALRLRNWEPFPLDPASIDAILLTHAHLDHTGYVPALMANRLPDHRNTVILVGYQTEGTRGRALLDGIRSVKMLGRYIPVRAEIVNVPAFSVHADQGETIQWLRSAPRPPDTTFIVHGEKPAAGALHDVIERELGWTAVVPRYLERVRLD